MGDKPYILVEGDFSSLREVRTPVGQIELLDELADQLRYDSKAAQTTEEKWKAIEKCSAQIKSFFIDFSHLNKDVSHLEIYLNPSELALIPFELLLDEKGLPRFIDKEGKSLVLTRNFRKKRPSQVILPKAPRVLYVHTKPSHKNFLGLPFPDVPFKNHLQSLRYALRHWEVDKQLTISENPTFEEFKLLVSQASESKNPFTHIHVLAHGSLIFDPKRPSDFEYGIAFRSDEPLETPYRATPTKDIKALFSTLPNLPHMVNYMVCDGANFTNGAKPDKNPVQATFEAGVPVVLGSQFPLSMKGSNLITKELYKNLFRGDDIRTILGSIRTQLFSNFPKDQHDWISLVSYLDLPNDYDFQRLLLKLEFQLAILNSIRNQVGVDDAEEVPDKDDFIRAQMEIERSIADLREQLVEIEHEKAHEAAFLENSGLLGSAYKRLAETFYEESRILKVDTVDKQKTYLREAKVWYKKAAHRNLSHHWSIVQYISLSTVLDGGLPDGESDYWNTARLAVHTEIELDKAKEKKSVWPYGTLLELYLLSPAQTQSSKKDIEKCMELLVSNAKASGKTQAIDSTRFQLQRYLKWWGDNDFKIPKDFFVGNKEFLESIIEKLTFKV